MVKYYDMRFTQLSRIHFKPWLQILRNLPRQTLYALTLSFGYCLALAGVVIVLNNQPAIPTGVVQPTTTQNQYGSEYDVLATLLPKNSKNIINASKPASTATGPNNSVIKGTSPSSPQVLATQFPPLLFGLGAQADGAMRERLYAETPLKLLSSWYNGPNDLQFMRGWQTTVVPQAYASGHSLHLIIWTGDSETNLNTAYGPACGRAYPLSAGFADDMRQLATIYNGSGTLYVSLFTELQTYPCQDNTWKGSDNYYRALMDQYNLAKSIFKQNAPNSKVSLSWGGWQADWDDTANGGGRSLIPHFASVMNSSDFQSFQAMDSKSNVQDITNMTKLLHAYGNGQVMLSHYKPDNGSQTTWTNDLNGIFTNANLTQLRQNGLFAFSFMDQVNMDSSEAAYQQAKQIVNTYGQ